MVDGVWRFDMGIVANAIQDCEGTLFEDILLGDHLFIFRKDLFVKGWIHLFQSIHQSADTRISKAYTLLSDIFHFAADGAFQFDQFSFGHMLEIL